jgi:hypothetical protein
MTDNIQGIHVSDSISLYNSSTGNMRFESASSNFVFGKFLNVSGDSTLNGTLTKSGNVVFSKNLTFDLS